MYINELEEAHDSNMTVPIEQFPGASIGVSDSNGSPAGVGNAVIKILKLQIYDYIPGDAQFRELEEGLLKHYRH